MSADENPNHHHLDHDNLNHDGLDLAGLYGDLLVSGSIELDCASGAPVEVRRGMAILTSEGQEAGRVAAVIIDKQDQRVTHILLSRQNQILEYRVVPIDLIEQVQAQNVLLRTFHQVVNSLPTWNGRDR